MGNVPDFRNHQKMVNKFMNHSRLKKKTIYRVFFLQRVIFFFWNFSQLIIRGFHWTVLFAQFFVSVPLSQAPTAEGQGGIVF